MPEEPERNRYAEIFDHAPIARLITDASGRVEEANRIAAQLLEVAASSLVGMPLSMFVSEDERREFEEQLLRAANTPITSTWLTWLKPQSGRPPFRAEVHIVASKSEAGHLHWAITDVTQRMAMEQELRVLTSDLEARVHERTREVDAERGRLAAVLEEIPAGLTIVDADGKFVMANAEAQRLLGDRLDREIEEGRTEIVREDGTYVALEVSVAPIHDADGNQVGAVRLIQDVSDRERQERAEREFVTNAAHQLQSPLAGILSAVEVLQSGAKDGPQRDVFLSHIEREANRLARLARALLVLARAQTGHEAPKDQVVALEPLLAEARAALRPAAGVRVELDCPPDLAVVTNRELVEQAVMNVAENAAKYTKDGAITLSAQPVDGGVELVVSDTGPGISQTERPRVTERFYRGSIDGADGFGLGFAIVRSAVEALDGELDVAERDEGGTVVRIRLGKRASLVEPA
jgi:PAS domain S-box-containing protein